MSVTSKEGYLNLQENGKIFPVRVVIEEGVLTICKLNEVIEKVSKTKRAFNERTINLRKVDNKIGISFTGGHDHGKLITISKVNEDSPGRGCINVDDVLLHVNGVPVYGIKHDEVVSKPLCQHINEVFYKKNIIMESNEVVELHLVSLCDINDIKKGAFDLQAMVGANYWIKHIEVDLTMSYVTRYHKSRNKLRANAFEICSPFAPNLLLRNNNTQKQIDINEWTKYISESIIASSRQQVEKLLDNFDLYDLVYFGWVSELLPSSKRSRVWTKRFLVLRQGKLEIYNKKPENVREWQKPEVSYEMCNITWKVLNIVDMLEMDYRPCSILLSSGTGGKHVISFEFVKVLNYWQELLHTEIINLVTKIKERTFKGKWNEVSVNFTINLQNGFVITHFNTNKLLWSKPFAKLRQTSDDGCSILHLEFTDSDTQEVQVNELQCAMHTMEAFLKTKVAETVD